MGRSVYVPREAEAVVYMHDPTNSRDNTYEYDDVIWYEFVEDLCNVITSKYPSFFEDDRMYGEGTSILYNSRSQVIVSEYCGCVSISLVPTEEGGLSEAWCRQISDKFIGLLHDTYPSECMNKIGQMSNGVAVYTSIQDGD